MYLVWTWHTGVDHTLPQDLSVDAKKRGQVIAETKRSRSDRLELCAAGNTQLRAENDSVVRRLERSTVDGALRESEHQAAVSARRAQIAELRERNHRLRLQAAAGEAEARASSEHHAQKVMILKETIERRTVSNTIREGLSRELMMFRRSSFDLPLHKLVNSLLRRHTCRVRLQARPRSSSLCDGPTASWLSYIAIEKPKLSGRRRCTTNDLMSSKRT